jgi:signal transduction histidine kinase
MRSRRPGRFLPLGIAILLLLVLAVVATLQYRWIGELSDMERQRMRSRLLAASSGFGGDFDQELSRLFSTFASGSEDEAVAGHAAERLARWNREAPFPRLIHQVFHAASDEQGRPVLQVLRPETGRFEPCPWPPDLETVRRKLAAKAPLYRIAVTSLEADPPRLIAQQFLATPRGAASPSLAEYLIVRLDERAIAGEILPALARRYFGKADGGDYALEVVAARDPGKVIFRSDPRVADGLFRAPEVRLDLFGLAPLAGPQTSWQEGGLILKTPRDRRAQGEWRLLVRHRDGSLEQAVAALRRRNLAVGTGSLLLLAAAAAFLWISTQRAQRLARQQMEFVAAVTHELNTPLAAMRSAGQNLAAGVVVEPGEVREYGEIIEKEGLRLSHMVGQTLELAGIQSGRQVYHPEPVAVGEILDGALASCRCLLEERRIEVEKDVPATLPLALADAAALQRAVQNLVENAAKHGGGGGWIGLRARGGPPGAIEITVADRGPGIPEEDLSRLFEPFYRGRDALKQRIPGSGLGLDLVRKIAEAHGGRVSVARGEAGRGSAFTLQLPTAAAAAGEGA